MSTWNSKELLQQNCEAHGQPYETSQECKESFKSRFSNAHGDIVKFVGESLESARSIRFTRKKSNVTEVNFGQQGTVAEKAG